MFEMTFFNIVFIRENSLNFLGIKSIWIVFLIGFISLICYIILNLLGKNDLDFLFVKWSSTLLIGVALLSPVLVPVYAEENGVSVPASEVVIAEETQQLQEQLVQEKAQLDAIKEEVRGTDYEQQVNTAVRAVEKIEVQLRANPNTIYDLDSIGARIEALTHVIEAITFSTNNLSNKVRQANLDMGFGITRLVLRIADPFASVDSIKAQVEAVKNLQQAVLAYPDLQPTDKATIYTKSKLDKAIWNTRFRRDKEVLPVKSFQVYHALNKAITHAVGVQLNPNTTVEQVDHEIIALETALQTALQ
ncbi:CAMP factor family pore-forming toxin [Streptococcus cameli]